MILPRRRSICAPILLIALLVFPVTGDSARADAAAPPDTQPPRLPGGIDVEAEHFEQTEAGDYVLEGSVTLSWNQARIQADRITVTEQRFVEAEGHVLLMWFGNRVSGTRLTYDLQEERGVIEEAIGRVQDYYFWADQAEKIGEDKLHLESATVTTCTQPVAYWSFSVSSANIRLNRYARMWNARLKTGKLPLLYLPYLVWPVKQDRATGLLLPDIRTTRNRGRAVSQELFVPLGRSADLTLLGRYYTEAGFGGGGELRFIPNRAGRAELSGFFIRDKVAGGDVCETPPCERYRAAYRQTQSFRNGFRMVADINLVSDFNYFSDFERELNLVSSPTILARLEFSRNGPWTSLNVREMRREQLFSGPNNPTLIQQSLPEIEWRARDRRLGKTPFYLSFESSAASIQQDGLQQGADINADYLRGDFFPTLSLPISRVPWIDITPKVRYRVTHYTQQQRLTQDPITLQPLREVLDRSLTRTLFGAGLEIVGPKLVRIYDTPSSRFSPRYKQTIEPNLSYGFLEDFERPDDILVFDEVDRFNGAGAELAYGLRSRLFAKRPRAAPAQPAGTGEAILLPGGTTEAAQEALYEPSQPGGEEPSSEGEPVEIATFELRQRRSFERDLSFADLDEDGVQEESSPYSSVQLTGRFNPSPAISLDLRSNYDILFDQISDVSLSGMLRNQRARIRFSLVHREGLGVSPSFDPSVLSPIPNDTQLRLTTGFSLFRNKLRLDLDGSIDANPQGDQARISDKRWRVTYRTQCCTFLIEKLNRNFSSLDARRDIYFRLDLKGVGKLLDLTY